jgi:GNAT superfamily N-acetyltransferase
LNIERQLTIEEFRPEHTDELVRMWRESFEFGVGIKDPHPIEEQRQYLLDVVIPNNTIRIALLNGRIVGFIAASLDCLSQLYIRQDFQRRGIGARLLEWAKKQSCGSLFLYTFERNAGARAFYERNGFALVSDGFEKNWQLDDLKYEWRADENAI